MATFDISVAVTGEMAALVCDAVDSGEYRTHADVVRAALVKWNAQREMRDAASLRDAWEKGIASGDDPRSPAEIFHQLRTSFGFQERAAGTGE